MYSMKLAALLCCSEHLCGDESLMVQPIQASGERLGAEACCGMQVGRTGSAVGIDIKGAATHLGRASVQGLIRADPEYARQAAPMRFHTHNVFMPSLRHKVCHLLSRCKAGVACPCQGEELMLDSIFCSP